MTRKHFNARRFCEERDAMLRALDPEKAVAFAIKWNGEHMEEKHKTDWNAEAVIAGMHKARLTLSSFSASEKLQSRIWLQSHGFHLPQSALDN